MKWWQYILKYKLHHPLVWLALFAGWYFFRAKDFPTQQLAWQVTAIKVIVLFDDDPLLRKEDKSNPNVPGGNGVLRLQEKNGVLHATRNIYLGRNIQNYPVSNL